MGYLPGGGGGGVEIFYEELDFFPRRGKVFLWGMKLFHTML